jgi:gamma-glutamylcyclotransferase (GGCT)/AIG2-like uncharacterized protein YtfP
LFVYGTLRSDGPESGLLAGLGRTGARARGSLFRLPAGYPALKPGGDSWIEGELVPWPGPARLTLIDRYEGVDEGLFRRAELQVAAEGALLSAWVYVMDDPRLHGGIRFGGGRWR